MSNSYIREMLIDMYGESCWLKGAVSKKNPLTLHHIVPVRFGGKTTIDNGALLTVERHQLFNLLENIEPMLADEVNYYLHEYHGLYPQIVDERVDTLIQQMYITKEQFDLEHPQKVKKKKYKCR